MEKLGTVIINLLTLGIPAIIKAIQEGSKPADTYTFKPNKKGMCKYAKKCCYYCHCLETIEDCKRLHCTHNQEK